MEENIKHEDIKNLHCGHELCNNCYDRLIRNVCPYCRQIITDKTDGNYDLEELDDEIIDEYQYNDNTVIDNVLPMSELYYIEDSFSFMHINNRRLSYNNKNKIRRRKKGFTSNKEKNPWDRKKKKWKKMRF